MDDSYFQEKISHLNEVTAQEKAKRAEIKESLKQFNAAVDKRANEIKENIVRQHKQNMKELDAQENLLNELLKNH